MNLKNLFFILILGLTLQACDDDDNDTTAVTVDEVLTDAATFLGGETNVTATSGIIYTQTGVRNMQNEAETVGAAMEISDYTATIKYDDDNNNMTAAYDRSSYFLEESGLRMMYTEIINDNLGYFVGADNIFFDTLTQNMLSDRMISTRKQTYLSNPHLVLKGILADKSNATLTSNTETISSQSHREVSYTHATYGTFSVFVGETDGNVSKITTLEHNHLYGDQLVTINFTGWETVSDINIATAGDIQFHNFTAQTFSRSTIEVNPTFTDTEFAFPAGAAPAYDAALEDRGVKTTQFVQEWAALGIPQDGIQTNVEAMEVATGVYHLTGGSHHTLVIEQASGIVVCEPPLYNDRSIAVADWISTQFPGKSITHVIVTHHHADHIGGVRHYVSMGAKIVVSELTVDLVTEIVNNPRTVVPDDLASSSATLTTETVANMGEIILADDTNPVNIYHVESTHAEDMLLIHLPEQKITYNGDLYSPFNPAPTTPIFPPVFKTLAVGLYDAITSGDYNIDMENSQVIGVHGVPGGVSVQVFLNHYNL